MPEFHVDKSIVINAPPQKVYEVVRDFRQWQPWSPWLIAEPECEVIYGEDGKSYRWDGKIVGSGEMAIVEEDQPKSIHYKLTFFRPFKSENTSAFHFEEMGGGTKVRWTMVGSLPVFFFFFKAMMTALVGMDYQRGLTMLKDYVEHEGMTPSKLEFLGQRSFGGLLYVGVKTRCAMAEMGPEMDKAILHLHSWFGENDLKSSGSPFSVYHKWMITKGIAEFTTALPVERLPDDIPPDLVRGELPACEVYAVKHIGPYRHLGNAWSSGIMHARAKVYRKNNRMEPFEIYENDPSVVDESELVTLVNFVVK